MLNKIVFLLENNLYGAWLAHFSLISCHVFELISKIHFNQWVPVSLLRQLEEASCSRMGSANQHISVLYVEYGTTDDILNLNQKRKLKCKGFHLRCCELPKHNTKAKDICFLIIWKMIYNLEKDAHKGLRK